MSDTLNNQQIRDPENYKKRIFLGHAIHLVGSCNVTVLCKYWPSCAGDQGSIPSLDTNSK